MSLPLCRMTQGLAKSNQLRPDGPDCLSIGVKMLHGNAAADPTVFVDQGVTANYDENIGVITLDQKIDCSGIEVTVSPDFPDDYQGFFALLRGRYEYKRDVVDPTAVVLATQNTPIPSELVYLDEDVESGVHYYYSVIALIGNSLEPLHFEYNPVTGFDTAYSYECYDHCTFLYERLPFEWVLQDEDEFVKNYICIFGALADSIKTDIEAYLLTSKSISNIEESQLQYLGDYIGWQVNEELREITQRTELRNAVTVYRQKGRNNAIEFLLQLITGWEIEFEPGHRRLFTKNLHKKFNPADSYATSHQGQPERRVDDEELGTSSGAASQTFDLIRTRVQDEQVEVENLTTLQFDTWLRVNDFTGSGTDDEHYTVTEDPVTFVSTITFGDGVNGAIPESGADIRSSYWYNGDVLKYKPRTIPDWKNAVGTRLLISETGGSLPFTATILSKVDKVLENFKASYAFYKYLIQGEHAELGVGFGLDDYTDVITEIGFITFNESGEHRNNDSFKRPVS